MAQFKQCEEFTELKSMENVKLERNHGKLIF